MRFVFVMIVSLLVEVLAVVTESPAAEPSLVKSVTIRAPRDIGYFVGDVIRADITLVVDDGASIDMASLPHPGAVTYWLELRSVDIKQDAAGSDHRYILSLVYQSFYDALDARQQEIPAFRLQFSRGVEAVPFDVPAWTIGVSPLREIAPPPKADPKDYLRPDGTAPYIHLSLYLWGLAAAGLATALCLLLAAYDRALWPFRSRPARAFAMVLHCVRKLRSRKDTIKTYLEALKVLHCGIDLVDQRSVLADDLEAFLGRHPVYCPSGDRLKSFFAASRLAFFRNEPERARRVFSFEGVEQLARHLAAAERTGA